MKRIIAITLILAGCTTVDEVLPIGRDTYMVTAVTKGGGGMGSGMTASVKTAMQFCASKGKQFQLDHSQTAGSNQRMENQIIFYCFDANDPAYQRTHSQKDPNIVIENRR